MNLMSIDMRLLELALLNHIGITEILRSTAWISCPRASLICPLSGISRFSIRSQAIHQQPQSPAQAGMAIRYGQQVWTGPVDIHIFCCGQCYFLHILDQVIGQWLRPLLSRSRRPKQVWPVGMSSRYNVSRQYTYMLQWPMLRSTS